MDITGVLVEARKIVDHSELPENLQAVAFGKAVDLLSRGVDISGSRARTESGSNGPSTDGSELSPLKLIAARLDIDLETVREVYYERDGTPELGISPTKLEPSMKGGTTQLALLVAAARQAAQLEDATSIELIRSVASDYKKYDSKNFTRAIATMADDVVANRGRLKEIRLSRPGWEHAKALISRLGGGES